MRALVTFYCISFGANGLRILIDPPPSSASFNLDPLTPECQSQAFTELRNSNLDTQRKIELENPALDGWAECDGSIARQTVFQYGRNQTASEKCTAANNLVKPRHDHVGRDMEPHREYSGDVIFDTRESQEDCASIQDLLKAVERGKRVWEKNVPNETRQSAFKPYGCNIPYPSPSDVKTILAKPAFIEIDGDSLTRHMTIGLSMILTGNYYDAGIAHGHKWNECVCDGQFSESLSCRALINFSFSLPNIGIHSDAVGMRARTRETCDQDDGPRIVWLQGGAHFSSDPHKTLHHYFKPKIAQFRSQCNKNLIFLVTGMNAQSRVLDEKYPHQSREKAKMFNDALADAFAQDENIYVVDFLNLTMEAQTSDGFHYLTDVNVAKASTLVALVDLISSKQKLV